MAAAQQQQQQEDEEDVWYQKEKLFRVSLIRFKKSYQEVFCGKLKWANSNICTQAHADSSIFFPRNHKSQKNFLLLLLLFEGKGMRNKGREEVLFFLFQWRLSYEKGPWTQAH